MAEMMPAMGGNPEATEMPRHRGSAIKNTKKPADMSWRQFVFKSAGLVLGAETCCEGFSIHSPFELLFVYGFAGAMLEGGKPFARFNLIAACFIDGIDSQPVFNINHFLLQNQ
jgi:hypothetical protein